MKTFIKLAKGWRLINKNPDLTKKELRNIVRHSIETYLKMEDKK